MASSCLGDETSLGHFSNPVKMPHTEGEEGLCNRWVRVAASEAAINENLDGCLHHETTYFGVQIWLQRDDFSIEMRTFMYILAISVFKSLLPTWGTQAIGIAYLPPPHSEVHCVKLDKTI